MVHQIRVDLAFPAYLAQLIFGFIDSAPLPGCTLFGLIQSLVGFSFVTAQFFQCNAE